MVTRINGFSGMDIDSLVKSMMATKRVPLDKVNQNKQILQWQRDDYREVNSKIYDFRNNKLSLTGYKNSASFNTQTAIMKDSAGKVVEPSGSAIKAEATANSTGIPMEVSVEQLATAPSVSMDKLGQGYKTSMTLEEVKYFPGKPPAASTDPNAPKPDPFKFTIKGQKTIEFPPTTTLASAMSQINNDSSLNVKATFDDVSGQLVLTSKTIGAVTNLNYPDGASDAKKAEIDAENNKRNLTLTGDNNSFLELFSKAKAGDVSTLEERLDAAYDPLKGIGRRSGENAKFSINGQALESSTNSATYNGVTLTFQGVTAANNPLTITTQVDSSKALETVKTFINDYNSLLEDMNKRISEERYKNFAPLSADQRKEMSESDIKAWEDKAKSGLIKNDPFIKNMLDSMRSEVSNQLRELSSMGITTGQYFENGKLYIDEAKFKKAVEANPQQLSDIFLGPAGNQEKSLLSKISAPMDTAMQRISERAGTSKFSGSLTATFNSESVMGRQLKQYNSRISTLTTQLSAAETRYYKQFAAMESAMNKYNSQLSQLTGAAS